MRVVSLRLCAGGVICIAAGIVAAGCSGGSGGGGSSQPVFNRENAMYSGGYLFNSSQLPPLQAVLTSADVYGGDGFDDLVMVRREGILGLQAPLGVFLAGGLSDGGLGEPVDLVSGAVSAPAVADFNADGRLDLVFDGPGIEVYFSGAGDTFDVAGIDTRGGSQAVRTPLAGDFDNDGDSDFAVFFIGGPPPHTLAVFLNNGTGTFEAVLTEVDNPGAQWGPLRGPAADFDRDGLLDVVAILTAEPGFSDGFAAIFFGNGDGSFAAPVELRLMAPFGVAVVGDVNLDGLPDVVTVGGPPFTSARGNTDPIRAHLSQGDRTFLDVVTPGELVSSGAFLETLGLDDVDGDAILDLRIHGDVSIGLQLYKGIGNGQFEMPGRQLLSDTILSSIAGDFTRDGITDIYSRGLLEGVGGGAFYEDPQFFALVDPEWFSAADVYGDGAPEFLLGDVDELQSMRPNGNGTFTQLGPIEMPDWPDYPNHFSLRPGLGRVGDLDEDGFDDVLLLGTEGGLDDDAFAALLGVMTLYSTMRFSAFTELGLPIIDLGELTDFDDDGHLDVTARETGSLPGIDGRLWVVFGTGDGTFTTPSQIGSGETLVTPSAADLDGDGKPSLLAGFTGSTDLTVYEVGANRLITPGVVLNTGSTTREVTVGRLDSDGRDDFAVLTAAGGGTLTIYYGSSTNGIDPGQSFATGGGPSPLPFLESKRLHILDLDGNGTPYIVVNTDDEDEFDREAIIVVRRTGERQFTPLPEFRCQIGLQTQFLMRDVTLDGINDLVSQDVFTIQVLRGLGGGEFQSPLYFDFNEPGGTLQSGDWDSDGDIDLGFFRSLTILKLNRLIP